MECRMFEITIISASDLENVRILGKMEVHARLSLGGGGEKRTPTDTHGEVNPAWYHTMRFVVSESMVENFNTMLVVKLYCQRKLGDRYIGEIHSPIKELFRVSRDTAGSAVACVWVQRGCVNSQGMLRFSYKFGDKTLIDKLLLPDTSITTPKTHEWNSGEVRDIVPMVFGTSGMDDDGKAEKYRSGRTREPKKFEDLVKYR